MLQRKVIGSLGWIIGLAGFALVVMSLTPLGNYMQHYEGASTLTGRTLIWSTAITAIKRKPLFGYGYLGTYYSFSNESGLVEGAVHLHNGFLEVAYNNGLVGEFLLLTLHFLILRNIFGALRSAITLRRLRPGSQQAWFAYLLIIGSLALYVHTFIQGLFGSQFGGRCMTPYMLWLAIFMLAETTRRITEKMLNSSVSPRPPQMYSEPAFDGLLLTPGRN
jgi:O-antigen ligase